MFRGPANRNATIIEAGFRRGKRGHLRELDG
jgi:hypothetical protein